MTEAWRGIYYDGESAKKHPVTVRIGATGLTLFLRDGTERFWPYEAITQTQGAYEREHVRLEHGGELGEALVIQAPGFLKAIEAAAPTARVFRPKSRSVGALIALGAAVGTVVAAAGLYFWGLPTMAHAAAMSVPPAWEAQLGKAVVDQLVPGAERCGDAVTREAVTGLIETLVPPGKSPYTYKVILSRSSEVNAFAAPGGYVVVCRGLLEKTRGPEELAGVLAHEIQHVELRHGTRALFREMSLGLIVASITGDVGALSKVIEAAGKLGALGMQRHDEEEADREGMRMLIASGLDPAGMVGAFEMLQQHGDDLPRGLGYLSSHPNTEDRLRSLRAIAATAAPSRQIQLEHPWRRVIRPCE